jgi:hypothetical protein
MTKKLWNFQTSRQELQEYEEQQTTANQKLHHPVFSMRFKELVLSSRNRSKTSPIFSGLTLALTRNGWARRQIT